MEDLQLNISTFKKSNKKFNVVPKSASEYKFLSKPTLTGKTIARKRPKASQQAPIFNKNDGEPNKKVSKVVQKSADKQIDLESTLRDLSENKGKFEGKSYEKQYDDNPGRHKNKPGVWISSLFKNNPDVPRVGQRAVKPIVEKVFAGKNFADLDVHPHSVANLQQNLGLKELMTVQQSAIPVILQGRDVLIRSQTGSGKTLAYALPIIEGLQAIRPKINRHDGIRVVVVVPTRELAVQTYELFVKLVKPFTWIVPGLLSGGQKRKAEKARLRKGLSILVGTPGRINDHLRHTKSISFCKTNCLVLDEADRLLDMGYEKDVAAIVKAIEDHKKAATYDPMALVKTTFIKKITSDYDNDEAKEKEKDEEGSGVKTDIKHHLTEILLSKERQTILLSATLTKAVENLAGITLMDPVFVDTSEGRAVVADSLKPQNIVHLNKQESLPMIPKTVEKKNEVEHKPIQKVEEIVSETIEVIEERKGRLKAFTGIKSLLSNDKEIKETITTSKQNNTVTTAEDSDSDSDYEYFKVQKELETKKQIQMEIEKVEEDDVKPSPVGNTFQEALKSAIVEDELVLPATVNQSFLVIPMKLRLVTLCSLIIEHCVNMKNGKMIVFMATLEMVDYHSELIEEVLTGKSQDSEKKKGNSDDDESSSDEYKIDYDLPVEGSIAPVDINVFSLHGSMPHEQRMHVFKMFRAARNGVLICTDVAARGLDVPHVDLVLQYCAPTSATDYVHRVGRTGRATKVGAAVMFLLPSEVEFVRYLEKKRIRLRQKNESECFEPLRTIVPSAPSGHKAAIAVQAKLEHLAHSSKEWLARASRAYTTWVSFYSGYPREVRPYLDSKQLHLGHAAKAFALRDTPGALARRAKKDPKLKKEKPQNRLSVKEEEEKKRVGFSKMKLGALKGRPNMNKQSSMHTASEFDSGLSPLGQPSKKMKK